MAESLAGRHFHSNAGIATILELPYNNPEHRVAAELVARAGARVVGEHRHPGLVECFTVLEGELTMTRSGLMSTLREGDTAVIQPNVWHDWWNASDRALPRHRYRCRTADLVQKTDHHLGPKKGTDALDEKKQVGELNKPIKEGRSPQAYV